MLYDVYLQKCKSNKMIGSDILHDINLKPIQ